MRSLAGILALMVLAPSSVLAQDAGALSDPAAPPLFPEPLLDAEGELEYANHPPPPSLGEPLALTIGGAVASGAGVVTLLVAGVQSADAFESGSPEVVAVAGTIVTALGVPLLLAGIYWLMERIDGFRAADRADDRADDAERASNPLLIRF